jgi:hypothetical protein
MTRSSSRNLGRKWKRDDIVEAEVLTVEGKVDYGNIKVNGKPTNAESFWQVDGTWSIGEYGAEVISLFHPSSRTQFTKRGADRIEDRETLVYDYEVKEEYSHWQIDADGHAAVPGHHGKVWIDLETGRALRVEGQTTYLPYDFPLSSIASVLQYGEVEIDGRRYMLPSLAQKTTCQRGSAFCRRLDIEFLDYRKFSSESTLVTTDSDIEFGGEVPEKPEPALRRE